MQKQNTVVATSRHIVCGANILSALWRYEHRRKISSKRTIHIRARTHTTHKHCTAVAQSKRSSLVFIARAPEPIHAFKFIWMFVRVYFRPSLRIPTLALTVRILCIAREAVGNPNCRNEYGDVRKSEY